MRCVVSKTTVHVERLNIEGLRLLRSDVYKDSRGWFMEAWRQSDIGYKFVQDNVSFTVEGALRGMHYQLPPHAQGKLIRCLHGEVFDVAVDLRKDSSSFSKWFGVRLTPENGVALWIPVGFAHGFLALKNSVVLYKCTAEYAVSNEGGIRWDDPAVGIRWPRMERAPLVSKKDRLWPPLIMAPF